MSRSYDNRDHLPPVQEFRRPSEAPQAPQQPYQQYQQQPPPQQYQQPPPQPYQQPPQQYQQPPQYQQQPPPQQQPPQQYHQNPYGQPAPQQPAQARPIPNPGHLSVGGGGGGQNFDIMSPPPTLSTSPAHHQAQHPPSQPQENASLRPLFDAVDQNRTGYLSEEELSTALINGDFTPFDRQTVRMMIRMFDTDRDGTIGFKEFCGLWNYLDSWRRLFDKFDKDHNNTISYPEFCDALVAFRYRLTEPFMRLFFATYDKRGEGVMTFDLFVQACISLRRMTDVFKKYDTDRDGFITLGFEDFLTEILRQIR